MAPMFNKNTKQSINTDSVFETELGRAKQLL